jgi:hypothetical protein
VLGRYKTLTQNKGQFMKKRANKVAEYKLIVKEYFSLATRKNYFEIYYKDTFFMGESVSECIQKFENYLNKEKV